MCRNRPRQVSFYCRGSIFCSGRQRHEVKVMAANTDRVQHLQRHSRHLGFVDNRDIVGRLRQKRLQLGGGVQRVRQLLVRGIMTRS